MKKVIVNLKDKEESVEGVRYISFEKQFCVIKTNFSTIYLPIKDIVRLEVIDE